MFAVFAIRISILDEFDRRFIILKYGEIVENYTEFFEEMNDTKDTRHMIR